MKAIVTGARGTVGSVLCEIINSNRGLAIPWDRQLTPPGDEDCARKCIEYHQPDTIFHLALPSNPTGIENEGWLINEKWTSDIAKISHEKNIRFLYISTVMVFTNNMHGPLTPDLTPDETEGYGHSKILGESAAKDSNPDTRVARIGWQIGKEPGSNNMIDFLHKQIEEKGKIEVSSKFIPAASFLEDTAKSLIQIASMPPGTYHVDGNTSGWNLYQIATALNQVHGKNWTIESDDNFTYDQRMQDDRIKTGKLEDRIPLKTLM